MISHHIQKEILRALVSVPSAQFMELKPSDLDSNTFTYHIQQLVKQHYIVKNDDGSYSLTPTGKAIGINIGLSESERLEEAHSVLLLAVRNDQGEWLLRERRVHPMYGKLGFVHGEPNAHESINQTAAKRLLAKTGLSADFHPRGSGYVRIFQGATLESFTHFTLLEASNVSGELITEDVTGVNRWIADPLTQANELIPSMKDLLAQLEHEALFFVELDYHLVA